MWLNWIWLALLVIVIVIDIFTSSFTFSWLGVGFLIAFIAGFYVDFIAQAVLAAIFGTISIIIGLKITKKYLYKNIPQEKLLVGKFEGKSFKADFDLDNDEECQVKVNEVFWRAKNVGDPIKSGDTYTIESIVDNKLLIKK